MNKLTQTHLYGKQAPLDNQQAQMLASYRNADKSERSAIIKHIDSFLEIVSKDAKTFWLKFRQKLKTLNE